MGRDAARKERTLPERPSPTVDIEATTDPGIVLDRLPRSLNEDRDHREPSLTVAKRARRHDRAGPLGGAADSGETPAPTGRNEVIRTCIKALVWIGAFPVLCVLPVVLALRVSVVSYQHNLYDGWVALSAGALAAMLLVCLYIGVFMLSFRIRRRLFMPALNACLVVVLCYGGYALFHLSTANAKTEEIRSYYTSLHPLLRVAVKNLTLVDDQLVITDLHRIQSDYQRMGLRPLDSSMHFEQPTGFIHAVDIRTNGRSKVKNLMIELYFVLMGFETLRHVGTADHLHVSLPLPEGGTLSASAR